MARAPRSRASRAERRQSKERAASALQHGLPVAAVPPPRRPEPASVGSWSEPGLKQSPAEERRVPIAVKLLMLGVVILGLIYGLTLFRDHKSSVEPVHPKATLQGEAAALPPAPSVRAVAPNTSELHK